MLAGALVFAAVRVALNTLKEEEEEEEEKEITPETLQSLFFNAIENAYFLYTQTQESDKNIH